jgi:hypothetical protein
MQASSKTFIATAKRPFSITLNQEEVSSLPGDMRRQRAPRQVQTWPQMGTRSELNAQSQQLNPPSANAVVKLRNFASACRCSILRRLLFVVAVGVSTAIVVVSVARMDIERV